jgi:hypothetical protein
MLLSRETRNGSFTGPPQREDKPERLGFADGVRASFAVETHEGTSDAPSNLFQQRITDSLKSLSVLQGNGERFLGLGTAPWGAHKVGALSRRLEDATDDIMQARKLGVPGAESIQTMAEVGESARTELATMRQRAAGAGGVASLVGAMGAGISDPLVMLTLPLGASAGVRVMTAVLAEAGINAALELAIQQPLQKVLRENGIEPSATAIERALMAGVGAGALTGLGRGLIGLLKHAVDSGQIKKTSSIVDAENQVIDMITETERNPAPAAGPHGERAHLSALDQAAGDARAGRMPDTERITLRSRIAQGYTDLAVELDEVASAKAAAEVAPVRAAEVEASISEPWQMSSTGKEWADLSIDEIDRAAFGFAASDVKTLSPEQLSVKWVEDQVNVDAEIAAAASPEAWARGIDLSEPIDVVFEGGSFKVDDGHHRWNAAKIRGVDLPVDVSIRDKPHRAIVERALGEGLPVPARVLAEYPDLAPTAKAAPAAAPAPAPPTRTTAAAKAIEPMARPGSGRGILRHAKDTLNARGINATIERGTDVDRLTFDIRGDQRVVEIPRDANAFEARAAVDAATVRSAEDRIPQTKREVAAEAFAEPLENLRRERAAKAETIAGRTVEGVVLNRSGDNLQPFKSKQGALAYARANLPGEWESVRVGRGFAAAPLDREARRLVGDAGEYALVPREQPISIETRRAFNEVNDEAVSYDDIVNGQIEAGRRTARAEAAAKEPVPEIREGVDEFEGHDITEFDEDLTIQTRETDANGAEVQRARSVREVLEENETLLDYLRCRRG